MRWMLVAPLLASLAPAPAAASGFIDAPKLVELCSAEGADAANAKAICLGYVAGSVDQLMAAQARRPRQRRTICPAQGATAREAVDQVVQHADWAKTAAGVGAAGLVRFAMEQAYPCRPSRGGPAAWPSAGHAPARGVAFLPSR